MFTKVCEGLSTKLPHIHFGELPAMIGLDDSDNRACKRCNSHKSPDGDLHGDQIFTLAGMELTLDCDKMRSSVRFNLLKLRKRAKILLYQQLE